MLPVKKRRHHYVWRHYLEAWVRGGTLACCDEGRIFSTNPNNVAVKKDFYRLQELSDADLWFLRETIRHAGAEPLRTVNKAWIPMFATVFRIKNLLKQHQDGDDSEFHEQIERVIQNAEEDLHGGIEEAAVGYLDHLREGNVDFLASPEDRALFLHFMAVQLMRTLKGQERVLRLTQHLADHPAAPAQINMEAIWPVLRHILATNIGFHLFVCWDDVRCTLLSADDADGFITSDQPIFNLAVHERFPTAPPDSMDLFYPVSPRFALRLELEHSRPELMRRSVSAFRVDWYNHRTWRQRGRQAYATTEELLATLIKGDIAS